MVHTAYESHPILDRLPVKIESIAAHENRLYVGTTEGALLVYNVFRTDEHNFASDLIDSRKAFSKKPITQIQIVESLGLLLSLSDGVISAHDLATLNLRRVVHKARGCNVFCAKKLSTSGSSLRLCCSAKKKLMLFDWNGDDFVEGKEFALPDTPRTLCFSDANVCLGFRREYTLLDCSTGMTIQSFMTGKSQLPLSCEIPPSEVLMAKDNMGFTVGSDGSASRRFGLAWSEMPQSMDYHHPYVLALLPMYLEIRTLHSRSAETLVQMMPLKGMSCVCSASAERAYVANSGGVVLLQTLDPNSQIDQLILQEDYEEALTLCEIFASHLNRADLVSRMDAIRVRHGMWLFARFQFDKAMLQFEKAHQLDPRIVIAGLFPEFLPKAYNPPALAKDVSVLTTEQSRSALSACESSDKTKAFQSLISYLTTKRVPLNLAQQTAISQQGEQLIGLGEVVDTALLQAYLRTREDLVRTFVSKPNRCVLPDTESVLKSSGKFAELVAFYRARGLHRQSLEILSKLAKGGVGDAGGVGVGSGSGVNNISADGRGEKYWMQILIEYLCALGVENQGLVLEFSGLPVENSPHAALSIFTEGVADVPPRTALSFLESHKLSPQLILTLLEHIVLEKNSKDADIHDELATAYLSQVMAEASKSGKAGGIGSETSETRQRLITFLQSSTLYRPEKMLSKFPFTDLHEERAILLSRIAQHDQALNIYIHKMNRPDLAEKYCDDHQDPEERKELYYSLLRTYLRPSDGEQPRVEDSLALLQTKFDLLDPTKVLRMLPPSLPVASVSGYFEAVLRHNSIVRRDGQVVKNLLRSEGFQVRQEWIATRSNMTKVTADKLCPVCKKRIGNSVFARYPNGVVVHFICSKDKSICPVTNKNFAAI